MVRLLRLPSFGTLKDIGDNSSLVQDFSYTLFLEGLIVYVVDDVKTQQSVDSFDVQFTIGHGLSEVVTFNVCIDPLPFPMVTILQTIPVYIQGEQAITNVFLKASQSRLLDSSPQDLIFDIIETPKYGVILDEHMSTSVSSIHNFTQQEINEKKIIYDNKRNDEINMTDRFQFRLRNKYYKSQNVYTVLISLMVNELTIVNNGFNITEGGTHVITPEEIFVSAPDGFELKDIYFLHFPDFAEIILNRPSPEPMVTNSDLFSLRDIENGYLVYKHNGTDEIMDNFRLFFVAKKPNTDSLHMSILVNVTIIPVNDNPPSVSTLRNDFYVVEGSYRPLTTSYLKFEDKDYGFNADDLIYSFHPTHSKSFLFLGQLCLRGVCSDGTDDFTWRQSDMNGDLTYNHVTEGHSITGNDDIIVLTVSDGELVSTGNVFLVKVTTVMPIRIGRDPIAIVENSYAYITANNLNLVSNEGNVYPDEYKFTVSQDPKRGSLYNTQTGTIPTSFTQKDIYFGIIQYRHHGSNHVSDEFNVTLNVRSFSREYSVAVVVTPVNDDVPQLMVKKEIFVDFLNLVHFNKTQLLIEDTDTVNATQLEYILTSNVSFGILEKRSDIHSNIYQQTKRFTQKDINEENVRYSHTHRYTGPGNFTDSFTFTVSDQVNEAGPFEAFIYVLLDNVPLTVIGTSVLEGGTVTLSMESIVIHHPYFAGTNGRVSVTHLVDHGSLKINGVVCTSCDFYTSDLADNKIEYTHSGSEDKFDHFVFFIVWTDLSRTAYGKNYTITILPVNDESPSVLISSGLIVWATEIITLTPSHLLTQDTDTSADGLMYQFYLTPSDQKDGHFSFKGSPGQVNLTFTQADIDNGLIIYVAKHDYEGFLSPLKFNVTDGVFIDSGVFDITARVVTLTKVANRQLRVKMGGNFILTEKELSYVTNNPEFDSSNISYYFKQTFQYGHVVDTDGKEMLSFTQADIDSGSLSYKHTAVNIWEPQDIAELIVYAPLTLTNKSILIRVDIDLLNESYPLAVNYPWGVIEGESVCLNQSRLDARNILYYTWKSSPGNVTLEEMSLKYVTTTPPLHGNLLLNGTSVTEFSHDDLVDGSLCYQNDGDEFTEDSIPFEVVVSSPYQELNRVSDVISIQVSLVNDHKPILVTEDLHKSIISGFWCNITSNDLSVIDEDNPPEDIIYVLNASSIDQNTIFRLKNKENITTFTQADINNGDLMLLSKSPDDGTSFKFFFHDNLDQTQQQQLAQQSYTFHLTIQEHELQFLIDKPILKFNQNQQEAIISDTVINSTTNGYRHKTRYVITDPPSFGTITVNGETTASFTQIDVDNGIVCYRLTEMSSTRDKMSIIVSNMKANVSFTVDIIIAANGIISETGTLLPPKMLVQLPQDIIILQELSAHRDIHIEITSQIQHGSLYLKYPNTDVTSRKIDSFQYSDLKNGYVYYKWNPSTEVVSGQNYTEILTGIVRVEGLAPGEFSLSLTLEAPPGAVLTEISPSGYPSPTPGPTGTETLTDSNESSFNLALYVPLFGMIIVVLIAFVVVVGFCCSQCKHIKQKLYHKSAAVNFNRSSPTQRSMSHRQSPTRPPHSPPLTGGFDQEYSDSEESSTPDVMMVHNHTQQPMTTISASHMFLPHSQCSYDPTSSGYHTHNSQLTGASPTFLRHQESPIIPTAINYPPIPSHNILTRNELRSSSPIRKVSTNRRNTRQYSSMTIAGKGRNVSLTRAKDYALHSLQTRPQVEDSSSSIGYDTSSLTQESIRLPSLSTPTPVNLESLINQEDVTDLYRKTHPVLKPSQYWV